MGGNQYPVLWTFVLFLASTPSPKAAGLQCHICGLEELKDKTGLKKEYLKFRKLVEEECDDQPKKFDCDKLNGGGGTDRFVACQQTATPFIEKEDSAFYRGWKYRRTCTMERGTSATCTDLKGNCLCSGDNCNKKRPEPEGVTCNICGLPKSLEDRFRSIESYEESLFLTQFKKDPLYGKFRDYPCDEGPQEFDCRKLHGLEGFEFGSVCRTDTVIQDRRITRTACTPRDLEGHNKCSIERGEAWWGKYHAESCTCDTDKCDPTKAENEDPAAEPKWTKCYTCRAKDPFKTFPFRIRDDTELWARDKDFQRILGDSIPDLEDCEEGAALKVMDCEKFKGLKDWRYGSNCGVAEENYEGPGSVERQIWHTCVPRLYKDPLDAGKKDCQENNIKGLDFYKYDYCLCSGDLCNTAKMKGSECYVCGIDASTSPYRDPEYLDFGKKPCGQIYEYSVDANPIFDCSKLGNSDTRVKRFVCYQKAVYGGVERGCKDWDESESRDDKYKASCKDKNEDCECERPLCNGANFEGIPKTTTLPPEKEGVTCQICQDPDVENYIDTEDEKDWRTDPDFQSMTSLFGNCKVAEGESLPEFDCRQLHDLPGWEDGSVCKHQIVSFKTKNRELLHRRVCAPKAENECSSMKNMDKKEKEVDTIDQCTCDTDLCDKVKEDEKEGGGGGMSILRKMGNGGASLMVKKTVLPFLFGFKILVDFL